MDQSIELKSLDRKRAVESLSRFVAASIDASQSDTAPFYHLTFDRVFPDNVYADMLTALELGIAHGALAQSVTRGPYLQNSSTTAISVRWRTSTATDSVVPFHGILGKSQASHRSRLPSGDSRGEDTKSWPATRMRGD